jgi:hypothetical protein
VNLRIVIDERQILALFGREWWGYGGIAPRYRLYRYFEGAFAETVKDADFENRKTSPEDRADGFPGGLRRGPIGLQIASGVLRTHGWRANAKPRGEERPLLLETDRKRKSVASIVHLRAKSRGMRANTTSIT